MRIELILEKFDLFAQAPGAVGRLREIILELAVRGKLVVQDPMEDPASLLLESIEKERAKLVISREIKARSTKPISADEQPYELPSGWVWTRLSTVGYELGQKVPDKPFTYIDVGGIDSDIGRISDRVEKLEPSKAPSRARKLVTLGTVIYSTVRPYLLNIAIVDQSYDPEPIASTAFGILHPFNGINNRYLFYWLRSAPFTAYVQAGMKGMAYPAINDEKFYNGPIALPPLAEQQRIVAKVDELMAVCDCLEAQQRERDTRHAALARAALARFAATPTPDNLQYLFHPAYDIAPDDLRSAILDLAVDGSISTDGRKKGPWNTKPLSELSLKVTDGTHQTPRYVNQGIPFVSTKDFSGGTLDFTHARKITIDEHRTLFKRCDPRRGDILLGRIGTIGKAVIVNVDFEFSLFVSVALIRPNAEMVTPEYLRIAFNSPTVKREFDKIKVGGATHTNKLNLGDLREVPIRIPPLAEQRHIVATVNHLLSLVDRYESQLTTARATATRLLDALVAELTGRSPGSRASSPAAQPPRQTKALENEERPQPPSERSAAQAGGTPAIPGRIDAAGLLALLRERGSLSSSEAQAATGLDPATLRALFKTLIDQAEVRTEGQRRGMRYLPTAKAKHAE